MFFRKQLLAVGLSALITPLLAQDPGSIDKIVRFEKESKGRFLKEVASPIENDGVDVFYVDANWTVNPEIRFISGTIHHHLKVSSARAEINFDLDDALSAGTVKVNGQNASVRKAGDVIFVSNPAGNFTPGQSYIVSIPYQGPPPSNGFGSFMTGTHEGAPILWTLSEPFGAKDWWPCRQNLFDKIDSLDIHVDIPDSNRVASNGLLQSVTPVGNRQVYYWKHRYPIATYLVAISVTNYEEIIDSVQLTNGNLFIQHYIYPENHNARRDLDLANTRRFLQIYDSLFIPYPFYKEKYGHAEFGWGGGMEHQTMSFMGGFSYDLVSHELAHQWFGDHVTCRSWEDIWLNEGFASYLSGLVYNVDSPDYYWLIWKKNTLKSIVSKPSGSVFVPNGETNTVNRIFDSRLTYHKGSFVLHMLRWTTGDEAFFTGVRNYLNNQRLRQNFAVTADLQAELEKTSGKNLDRFFDQWFYKEGHPTYHLEWNEVGSVAVMNLYQSQSDTLGSVDFFEMNVPVRVKGAGRDTTIVLDHKYSGQTFMASLGFKPDSMYVDPEMWLIMAPATVIKNPEIQIELASLFPNPTNNVLNLVLTEGNTADDVFIINSLGQKMSAPVIAKDDNWIQLNTSELESGTYVFLLGEKVIGRFIKIQ